MLNRRQFAEALGDLVETVVRDHGLSRRPLLVEVKAFVEAAVGDGRSKRFVVDGVHRILDTRLTDADLATLNMHYKLRDAEGKSRWPVTNYDRERSQREVDSLITDVHLEEVQKKLAEPVPSNEVVDAGPLILDSRMRPTNYLPREDAIYDEMFTLPVVHSEEEHVGTLEIENQQLRGRQT
jgi:hypothetical protein